MAHQLDTIVFEPRDDMDMNMIDDLARVLAVVHADIHAVRAHSFLNGASHLPNRFLHARPRFF